MEQNAIEEFLAAYRRGATADFVQPWQDGEWGTLWTIPPCDTAAIERAGRQILRMGATEVLWVRRAQLRGTRESIDAVIFTELPQQLQTIIAIESGNVIEIGALCEDTVSRAFMSALKL